MSQNRGMYSSEVSNPSVGANSKAVHRPMTVRYQRLSLYMISLGTRSWRAQGWGFLPSHLPYFTENHRSLSIFFNWVKVLCKVHISLTLFEMLFRETSNPHSFRWWNKMYLWFLKRLQEFAYYLIVWRDCIALLEIRGKGTMEMSVTLTKFVHIQYGATSTGASLVHGL